MFPLDKTHLCRGPGHATQTGFSLSVCQAARDPPRHSPQPQSSRTLACPALCPSQRSLVRTRAGVLSPLWLLRGDSLSGAHVIRLLNLMGRATCKDNS
ncbi:hypothetical protein DPEC_G00066600 [Dallia pectoralis]|uniref:Uncharacterized protein n=1 Tax=Dallia pectoralis TaxID=75939 RepID=A0ACC2H8Z2_DALPE|nr:hypothetical protein DPEC_G00066600 [Dallia pectoralis]